MTTAVLLPPAPSELKAGADLVVGSFHPQKISGGGWTICRAIGMNKWFPLTLDEAHAWLTWPNLGGAVQWMIADQDALNEYPLWGR